MLFLEGGIFLWGEGKKFENFFPSPHTPHPFSNFLFVDGSVVFDCNFRPHGCGENGKR